MATKENGPNNPEKGDVFQLPEHQKCNKFIDIYINEDLHKSLDFKSPAVICMEHGFRSISSRLMFTKILKKAMKQVIKDGEPHPRLVSVVDEEGIQPTDSRVYAIQLAAEYGADEVELHVPRHQILFNNFTHVERDIIACSKMANHCNLDLAISVPHWCLKTKFLTSKFAKIIKRLNSVTITNNPGTFIDSESIFDDVIVLQQLGKEIGSNKTKMFVNYCSGEEAMKIFKGGPDYLGLLWNDGAEVLHDLERLLEK